ncbi:MAG: FprA family A-type flavoprotein [Xanthomonadales bacterium]|nr:FprA family A-type flavoprotein [Xanthomonadales bacterium]
MAVELFRSGEHRCIAFNDLVRGDDGVQANQFLIIDHGQAALIDPGGALLYTPVSMAVAQYVALRDLTYVLASHQDPDVIGSADRWLMYSGAEMVCSRLWGRFVPHSVPHYVDTGGSDRFILIPDEGMELPLGECQLRCVPAHFLHSVGNFQFYDPVSKILFSGDLGASMVDDCGAIATRAAFDQHIGTMAGFHRRYMAGNRACRAWARHARRLQIDQIVPQHGAPIVGEAIPAFIEWIDQLQCGLDLIDEAQRPATVRTRLSA